MFVLFLFTASACHSSRIQTYHHLSKNQNMILNTKLSVKKIKREMILINDTTHNQYIITKELPLFIEEIPGSLKIEVKYYNDTTPYLRKITVVFMLIGTKIKEEYYFKNNALISYEIKEYKFGALSSKETGYAKNLKDIVFYINNKKTKPDKIAEEIIKMKIRESVNSYLKLVHQ